MVAALAVLAMGAVAPTHAAPPEAVAETVWQSVQWQVDGEGRVAVVAVAALRLPTTVEDALRQGVPVYFIARAELARPRLRWFSQVQAKAERHWRLSHQPLTGAWRLQPSAEPFTAGQRQTGLAQSFASLAAALRALGQLGSWPVAPLEALQPGVPYTARVELALDRSLLPTPLQFGLDDRADWALELRDQQRLLRRGNGVQTETLAAR